MEYLTCARPYANAAFRYAQQLSLLEQWLQMLELSTQLMAHKKIARLFFSDSVSKITKLNTFIQLCKGCFSKNFINFITLLSENNRLSLLPYILENFMKLKNDHAGIQKVQLISAFPLTDPQLKTIKAKMTDRFKQSIEISIEQQPDILGGYIVKADNLIIDGSIRSRMQKLARTLTT